MGQEVRNAISAATMLRPATKITPTIQDAINKTTLHWNGRIFVAADDPTLQIYNSIEKINGLAPVAERM